MAYPNNSNNLPAVRQQAALEPYTHLSPPPARQSESMRRRLEAARGVIEAHSKLGVAVAENCQAWGQVACTMLEIDIRLEDLLDKRDQAELARLEREITKAEHQNQLASRNGTRGRTVNDLDEALSALLTVQEKTFARMTQSGVKDGDPRLEMLKVLFQEQVEKLFR